MLGEKGLFIDASRCVGCYSCYLACKQWNGLPFNIPKGTILSDKANERKEVTPLNWIGIEHQTVKSAGSSRFLTRPRFCYHCKDARCAAACPVNAISEHQGWQQIDLDRCIGCAACERACLYGAVKMADYSYNYSPVKSGLPYKCDGCQENYSSTPKCAMSCPTGAIEYGVRINLLQKARARLTEVKREYPDAVLYGVTEYGGQNVLFLLPVPLASFKSRENVVEDRLRSESKALFGALSFLTGSHKKIASGVYRFARFIVSGKWA